MAKLGIIIKHSFRDWDYRIDVVEIPEDTKLSDVRLVVERQMIGPFEVIAITDKISDRDISEGLELVNRESEKHVES